MAPEKNTCQYVKLSGEVCGNKCFREFCYRHTTGQKFRPCLEGCGKWTSSKNQYCKCTNKSGIIEIYKKREQNEILGKQMKHILAYEDKMLPEKFDYLLGVNMRMILEKN
jgi:hypothetical protein